MTNILLGGLIVAVIIAYVGLEKRLLTAIDILSQINVRLKQLQGYRDE